MSEEPNVGYTLKAGAQMGKAFAVKVVQANNLVKATKAYVKLILGKQQLQTDALKKSANPIWNQLLFFSSWRPDETCYLQLWGQRSGRSNDRFLGGCEIKFQFEQTGLSVLHLNLTSDQRWPKAVSGTLKVEVCNLDLRRVALVQTTKEIDTLHSLRSASVRLEQEHEKREKEVDDILKVQHETVQINESLLAKLVRFQKMTTEVQRENEKLEAALRQLLPHCEKNALIRNEIARLEIKKTEINKALLEIQAHRAENARKTEEELLWEKDEILKESVALQQAEIVALEETNAQLELKMLRLMRQKWPSNDQNQHRNQRGASSDWGHTLMAMEQSLI